MKPNTAIALVFVVVVAFVVVFAMIMGWMPGFATIFSDDVPETPTPSNEHELSLSHFEIFSILEIVFGMDLTYSEIEPYIDALHMRTYGRDDMDAQTLLQWFESEYAQDGWTSEGTRTQISLSWSAFHEGWTKTTNARMVTIGEGVGVTTTFGYDTVYIVSYGPITTYREFIIAVVT